MLSLDTFFVLCDLQIQARTEFIVRGLNRVFAQSVFGSFPAYRQLHFKIAQIEPIQPLCIDCDPDSVDYAHQLMDDFAKMDFTEYCLAYLFTDKNLKTTMSLANHDTVCEAFRPTCPRGQKSCRILGAIHEWPHWRSPNVGVVSFARVGHHINDEFTLLSVAHAFGYSFGAKSDEYEGNEQCQNQGFIMSRLPALDRYSVCSYRAMTASLNKILFPTANPGTKRRNCFQESDAELKPSFCGNGILEAGEACDCGYNNDACEGTNLTMCCNPPGTNRNEKTGKKSPDIALSAETTVHESGREFHFSGDKSAGQSGHKSARINGNTGHNSGSTRFRIFFLSRRTAVGLAPNFGTNEKVFSTMAKSNFGDDRSACLAVGGNSLFLRRHEATNHSTMKDEPKAEQGLVNARSASSGHTEIVPPHLSQSQDQLSGSAKPAEAAGGRPDTVGLPLFAKCTKKRPFGTTPLGRQDSLLTPDSGRVGRASARGLVGMSPKNDTTNTIYSTASDCDTTASYGGDLMVGSAGLNRVASSQRLARNSSAVPMRFHRNQDRADTTTRWDRSKKSFRLKCLLCLACLGVPANLYIFYCFKNPPLPLCSPEITMEAANFGSDQIQIDEDPESSGLNNVSLSIEATSTHHPLDSSPGHINSSGSTQSLDESLARCRLPESWEISFEPGKNQANHMGEKLRPDQMADHDNASFECYEDIPSAELRLGHYRFWIEGNLISLIVLTTIDKRNSFNLLLVILAITDSILILFYLVDTCYIDGLLQPKTALPTWYLTFFPKILHPLKHVAMSVCIYMILAIAFNRYQAICNPMLYRPKAFVSFLIVLLISVSTNLARFNEFETVIDKNQTYLITTNLNENPNFVVFNSNFELFTTGLVPLFALCFYNFMIYMQIRKSNFIKGRFVGSRIRSQSNHTHSELGPGIEMGEFTGGSNGVNGSRRLAHHESFRTLEAPESSPFLAHQRGMKYIGSPSSLSTNVPRSKSFLGSVVGVRPFSEAARGQQQRRRRKNSQWPPPSVDEGQTPSVVGGASTSSRSIRGESNDFVQTKAKSTSHTTITTGADQVEKKLSVSNSTRRLLKRSVSGSSSSPAGSLRNGGEHLGRRAPLEGNHPPHAMNQRKRSFRTQKTAQPYRRKTEKSTAILVGIILVFISCHVLRFSIQLYEVFAQGNGVHRHYKYCERQGKLHTPSAMLILASVSHLLIIVNSSVNVLIYYCCGERFRRGLCRLFGFRPKRSSTGALAVAQAEWIRGAQNGDVVGVLAFDLSSAFDTVDKAQLLPKLKALGVGGTQLAWFESYLSGGRQCVNWDGTRLDFSNVTFGVRQGSILGPILYLVLGSDMPDFLGIGERDDVCYADDT
eukprot:maker-scaffold198_size266703-snap-gene-1.29 protein:Tk12357 transcript:maker-scaffold198_size266703-snap-gene-1.29-mRNA-1 annotation:"hypothetical protein BRAFLDRAFT_82878"